MNRCSLAGTAGLLCVLSPLAAFAGPANSTAVELQAGTPISIHLTSQLSSRSAHEGEQFVFSVTQDVRSAGWLVIPAGAQGSGEVVSVENAASNGRPGEIGLQFDYVYAVDGERILIKQTENTIEGMPRSGAASHRWGPGREASIDPKTTFSVVVDSTVNVKASDHLADTAATRSAP